MAQPIETFTATVVSHRTLAPGVREVTFERDDGAPVVFVAGQWMNLELAEKVGELRRAYSIASPPDGTGRFELAVTRVEGGPGSTKLHSMDVGAKVSVTGPQGIFYRKERGPSLFVATGTGFTPLRSMLKDALAKGDDSPMRLIFGVRTPEDRIYVDELRALEEKHPNLRAFFTLSRPPAQGWDGRTGYVQTHVRELYEELARSGRTNVYICGLQKMVSAVRDLLRKEMGLERQQVHSERYD
jgi:CDP-4-dehydro-6-deoxyglucose reductase, E3